MAFFELDHTINLLQHRNNELKEAQQLRFTLSSLEMTCCSIIQSCNCCNTEQVNYVWGNDQTHHIYTCTKQLYGHFFFFLFESPVCGSFRSNAAMMRLGEVLFISCILLLFAAGPTHISSHRLHKTIIIPGIWCICTLCFALTVCGRCWTAVSRSASWEGVASVAELEKRIKSSLAWEICGRWARTHVERRVKPRLHCEYSVQQVIIWRKWLGGMWVMRCH